MTTTRTTPSLVLPSTRPKDGGGVVVVPFLLALITLFVPFFIVLVILPARVFHRRCAHERRYPHPYGDKIELLLQVAKVIQVEGVHADDVCVRACARVCRSA